MRLILAIKAFFRAWRNPEKAKEFLEDKDKSCTNLDPSHLRLLSLLQQSARLIDFFKEDISSFSDAEVGAAARKIHQDCSKWLEEWVTIRPLREEQEGASIQVPKGYDSKAIKLVGKVKGEPPYVGTLVHKGWKAHKRSLPKVAEDSMREIIFPAEIEVR